MRRVTTLAALVTVAGLLSSALSAAPIRTALQRNYFALYDAQSKVLDCVSETPGREWRVNVAHGVPSMSDWSARSTAAGPVFVYSTSSGVQYVLLRYLTGSTNAEHSGESLRGGIAPGRLLSASWQEGQYGAKVTVVSLSGTTEYTTDLDINMWGTSKQLAQRTRTVLPKREKLPGGKLSFEVPIGFTANWDAGSGCMGLKSSDAVPVGILLHAAEGSYNISEFADEFMKVIGPTLGAADLKQVLSDRVNVGPLPGLLRLAKCTMKGQPATFAFVFCGNAQNTYVMVYGARDVDYDRYASLFYRLLGSIRFE